ncbi:hypothetical protein PACTADRAFT_48416 [Pachysolen tannophilus NRRL Y-2460]|uniref:Prefoldin subunit 6 n=1 Tax=Pachysolen tannophilus NRRL Y-2460 TaxID=669874 RepID=A0A1E4TXY3_PACTA|nr:hypothetical protein PACTADRAFT_48416 [Pachysolen tannophilus NRRL Y-2460]
MSGKKELSLELEKLSKKYTELQTNINEIYIARQKLETQYQENKIVKEELDAIKSKKDSEEEKIFKLVGPVLLPQDLTESCLNVDKRIEFILKEIEKAEKNLVNTEKSIESTRDELIGVRTKLQGLAGSNSGVPAVPAS